MPLPNTTTSRILVAAARGVPIHLDSETRRWIEELAQSGHITLTDALDADAATVKATVTSLGQELLDYLDR